MLLNFIVVAGVCLTGGSTKEVSVSLMKVNAGVIVTVELALVLTRALRTYLLHVSSIARTDMMWESPLCV